MAYFSGARSHGGLANLAVISPDAKVTELPEWLVRRYERANGAVFASKRDSDPPKICISVEYRRCFVDGGKLMIEFRIIEGATARVEPVFLVNVYETDLLFRTRRQNYGWIVFSLTDPSDLDCYIVYGWNCRKFGSEVREKLGVPLYVD